MSVSERGIQNFDGIVDEFGLWVSTFHPLTEWGVYVPGFIPTVAEETPWTGLRRLRGMVTDREDVVKGHIIS